MVGKAKDYFLDAFGCGSRGSVWFSLPRKYGGACALLRHCNPGKGEDSGRNLPKHTLQKPASPNRCPSEYGDSLIEHFPLKISCEEVEACIVLLFVFTLV